MDESNSNSSLLEQTTVHFGLSPPSSNLTPEMNSPSWQFLSESDTFEPSFNVKLLQLLPPPPLPLEFECTCDVPSKFWQKTRIVIFLNELTCDDCEFDDESLALLPFGPLDWLELEAEEDCEDDFCSETSLNMKPDAT